MLVYKWRLMPKLVFRLTGFTPSVVWSFSNGIILSEDYRVFELWCRTTFHLTCPILFRQVHMLYTVTQSYSHTIVQLYNRTSCTFIHACTHTFVHSQIHNIYTTSFTHDYISQCLNVTHSLVWLYPFNSVLAHHCVKRQVLQTDSLQLRLLLSKVSFPALLDDGMLRMSFPGLSNDWTSRVSFPGSMENRMSRVSFPGLSDDRMSRVSFLALLGNRMSKVSFPALSDDGISKVSFPALSDDEMSSMSFPGLSDDGMSRVSFPAVLENGMSRVSFLGLSDDGMSGVSFSALLGNRMSKVSFPALSDDGISKVSFPALLDDGMPRMSFPSLSDDGMSFPALLENRMSRVSRVSFLALLENGMSRVSFPGLSDNRISKSIVPRYIGWWDVTHQKSQWILQTFTKPSGFWQTFMSQADSLQILILSKNVIPSVSDPEMSSIKHFSKWQVLQTNNFANTFNFPMCLVKMSFLSFYLC